jgi:5'-nucleotidase
MTSFTISLKLDFMKTAFTKSTNSLQFLSQAEQVEFLDEVESIKSEVDHLKTADPDLKIFIALGHSGFEMDQKIASDVPDIDVVVGGHTNTFLYSGEFLEIPESKKRL